MTIKRVRISKDHPILPNKEGTYYGNDYHGLPGEYYMITLDPRKDLKNVDIVDRTVVIKKEYVIFLDDTKNKDNGE